MSDYITEDIQISILKHLPVETLLRSRCVCKFWKQVIDSHPFIQDHLALQKPRLILEYKPAKLLIADPCKLPSFNIFYSQTPERLRLVGTLHGIICFYNQIQYNFQLWNPCIRKLTSVKKGPIFDWDFYDSGEYVIAPCCGFWIDPLTKDFKIVMFKLFDEKEEDDEYDEFNVCNVYSSVRGDWKQFPLRDEHDLDLYSTMEVAPAVVIDGVGYWTAYYDFTDNEEQEMVSVAVLLFDFVKEDFLEPIGALSVQKGWNLPVLCDRDGALSLVYIDQEKSCDIFMRKDDKWVLIESLLLFPFVERCIWGMVEVKNEEKKIKVLASVSEGLILFDNSNPEVMTTWNLVVGGIKDSNVVVANGFVESLLFPDVAPVIDIVGVWYP